MYSPTAFLRTQDFKMTANGSPARPKCNNAARGEPNKSPDGGADTPAEAALKAQMEGGWNMMRNW